MARRILGRRRRRTCCRFLSLKAESALCGNRRQWSITGDYSVRCTLLLVLASVSRPRIFQLGPIIRIFPINFGNDDFSTNNRLV